jgi:general secretion pathway protein H
MPTSVIGTWNDAVSGGRRTADGDATDLPGSSPSVLWGSPTLDSNLRKISTVRRPPSAVHFTSGFTLMEVLVVIVIIGVIVSVATISFGVLGGDREAEDETRRFWVLLQQAREEAELQSLDFGVHIAAHSYEFLRLDSRRNLWLPVENDALYMPRELPEGLRFRVWIEQREVILKPTLPERTNKAAEENDEDDDEPKTGAQSAFAPVDAESLETSQKFPPHIMVLSSGEIFPFEVQIERDSADATWRIVGLPDNDLRIERRGQNRDWIMVNQTNVPVEEDDGDSRRARN